MRRYPRLLTIRWLEKLVPLTLRIARVEAVVPVDVEAAGLATVVEEVAVVDVVMEIIAVTALTTKRANPPLMDLDITPLLIGTSYHTRT
jgi:hypothetical protein